MFLGIKVASRASPENFVTKLKQKFRMCTKRIAIFNTFTKKLAKDSEQKFKSELGQDYRCLPQENANLIADLWPVVYEEFWSSFLSVWCVFVGVLTFRQGFFLQKYVSRQCVSTRNISIEANIENCFSAKNAKNSCRYSLLLMRS